MFDKKYSGFTLLEVLIALFIFTLLSVMLMGALHSVISAQSGTENNAMRLRQLQITLLMLSRDIEQAVDRPIRNASDKEEPAFVGTSHDFTLTHMGYANPNGAIARSTLQRTRYYLDEKNLWRETWTAVDLAATSKSSARRLPAEINEISFQYLNQQGKFVDSWPADGQKNQPLPRAIRIHLTVPQWGKLSQLYVISA